MIQPTPVPLYQPPEGRPAQGTPWGGQPAWEPATPGRVAVWCALALVAVRFSFVNDLITALAGVNPRLLYIVTVPALVGFFFGGGLGRVFQSRAAIYWIAFSLWAVLATPFSWWRGGSADLLWQYFRTTFPMLLVIAGLVVTWKDCRRLMTVLALSGAITLIYARVFARNFGGGRLGLEFGTVAGPHDMAAHILLLLPFLLWIVLTPKGFFLWRLAASGAILLGLYVVVGTASRSAGIALAADLVVLLLRATPRQRLATLVLAPLLIAGLLAVAPESALHRMGSYSVKDPTAVWEAVQSSELRKVLLRDSIQYTFTHPLFGVGPGQFTSYEFAHSPRELRHVTYRQTHNTFTQISSECGLPGFFFFMAAIVTALRGIARARRRARGQPECQDIAIALFCTELSMAGFLAAILFMSFGYFYHLPSMVAVMIAVARAAQQELDDRQRRAAGSLPVPVSAGQVAFAR